MLKVGLKCSVVVGQPSRPWLTSGWSPVKLSQPWWLSLVVYSVGYELHHACDEGRVKPACSYWLGLMFRGCQSLITPMTRGIKDRSRPWPIFCLSCFRVSIYHGLGHDHDRAPGGSHSPYRRRNHLPGVVPYFFCFFFLFKLFLSNIFKCKSTFLILNDQNIYSRLKRVSLICLKPIFK